MDARAILPVPGEIWWTQQQILSMSPGLTDTIYLTSDGSVWTMGRNTRGQLGDGTIGSFTSSSIPVHVALPGPIKQVGGEQGTCWAASADGLSVYAWGDNSKGELGIGERSVIYSDVPVQVKLALPSGVSVVSMGDGLWCTLALLSNGQVMAWGDNNSGQCGLDPKTAGNYIYSPTVVPGLSGVTSLASGDYYSMALKQDGSVWAWGQNTKGQLGPDGPTPGKRAYTYRPVEVTGLPPVKSIVGGGRDGVALDASGHIWEWGRNKFGELGNGAVDTSDTAHPTPSMVAGLPQIVSFDSQGPTVLAADASGQVYAWGFNKLGAVGNGQTTNTGTPQLVLTIPATPGGEQPSVQVAASHFSSYAFNVGTGETFAWGKNTFGQLGIPPNDAPNPVPVNITSAIAPTLPQPATPSPIGDGCGYGLANFLDAWSNTTFRDHTENSTWMTSAGNEGAGPSFADWNTLYELSGSGEIVPVSASSLDGNSLFRSPLSGSLSIPDLSR